MPKIIFTSVSCLLWNRPMSLCAEPTYRHYHNKYPRHIAHVYANCQIKFETWFWEKFEKSLNVGLLKGFDQEL